MVTIIRFFLILKTSLIFYLNKIFPKVEKILLLKKKTFLEVNISRNSSNVFFQSTIPFRLKKAPQNIPKISDLIVQIFQKIFCEP